jgi:hypothetical protein
LVVAGTSSFQIASTHRSPLNDEHRSPVGDGPHHLRQPIRHDWRALGVPDPFAGPVGIRTLLAERLLTLAALRDEGAVRLLVLDTLNDEGERTVRVVIRVFSGDDLSEPGSTLAVGLRRRLAGQRLTRAPEVDAVEKLH